MTRRASSRAEILKVLQANPLFGGLSAEALADLAALGYTRRAQRGELLYLQGEPGHTLYLILTGEVRISANSPDGQELHLNTLGPGQIMGEIALLDGGPRTASATVTEAGELFCIERQDFLRLLQSQPAITMQLLQLVCQRVRWISELLEDSTFLSADARLAKRLLYLAQSTGRLLPDGCEISLSQAELAHFLNLSRQAVNGLLQRLQDEDLVKLGRGRLLIRDQDALLRRTLS